jgi:hypothetical protein
MNSERLEWREAGWQVRGYELKNPLGQAELFEVVDPPSRPRSSNPLHEATEKLARQRPNNRNSRYSPNVIQRAARQIYGWMRRNQASRAGQ